MPHNYKITDLITAMKFWLQKTSTPTIIIQQLVDLVTTVLHQNYFQFDGKYYKPPTGISVGSLLSATMAEVYLQYLEEMFIKHWLETHEITFYQRYVDDVLIIFDTSKTNEHIIQASMNRIHPLLHFTPTTELDNVITYLDLTIH
jgi:hypothetical protein